MLLVRRYSCHLESLRSGDNRKEGWPTVPACWATSPTAVVSLFDADESTGAGRRRDGNFFRNLFRRRGGSDDLIESETGETSDGSREWFILYDV